MSDLLTVVLALLAFCAAWGVLFFWLAWQQVDEWLDDLEPSRRDLRSIRRHDRRRRALRRATTSPRSIP